MSAGASGGPAAGWTDLAIAAAAAYQARMTGTRDVTLLLGAQRLDLHVEPATTLAALAASACDQRSRPAPDPAGAPPPAPAETGEGPGSAQVAFGTAPSAVAGLAFVFAAGETARPGRQRG